MAHVFMGHRLAVSLRGVFGLSAAEFSKMIGEDVVGDDPSQEELLEAATTTMECMEIFADIRVKGRLASRAIRKALDLATRTDECLEVYNNAPGANLKKEAAIKAYDLASTPEDVISLYAKGGYRKKALVRKAVEILGRQPA